MTSAGPNAVPGGGAGQHQHRLELAHRHQRRGHDRGGPQVAAERDRSRPSPGAGGQRVGCGRPRRPAIRASSRWMASSDIGPSATPRAAAGRSRVPSASSVSTTTASGANRACACSAVRSSTREASRLETAPRLSTRRVQERRLRHQLAAQLAAPLLGGAQPQGVAAHRPDRRRRPARRSRPAREQRSDGVVDKGTRRRRRRSSSADGERCQRSDLCDRRQPLRGVSR